MVRHKETGACEGSSARAHEPKHHLHIDDHMGSAPESAFAPAYFPFLPFVVIPLERHNAAL